MKRMLFLVLLAGCMLLNNGVANGEKVNNETTTSPTVHATPIGSAESGVRMFGDSNHITFNGVKSWYGPPPATEILGGCASPFTNYPVTFEAAASGACTNETTVDLISGTTNCDYTTSPPEGTEALLVSGSSYVNMGSSFAEQTGNLQITTYVRLNTLTGNPSIVTTVDGAALKGVALYFSSASSNWLLSTHGFAAFQVSAPGSVVVDTTYKVCLKYDVAADDAQLLVDAVDGTWCAGALVDISANGAAPQTGIDGIRLNSGSGVNIVYDTVSACNY